MGDWYRIDVGERERIDADPGASRSLKNYGPDPAYYGGAQVSATNNTGTLAVGSTLTIPPGFFFTSAGRSRLFEAEAVSDDPGAPVFAQNDVPTTLNTGQFAFVENTDGSVSVYYEDGT